MKTEVTSRRVLFVGGLFDSSRAQAWVNAALKRTTSGQFRVAFWTPGYGLEKRRRDSPMLRRLVEKAASWIDLAYKAAVSDVVVLLPMNSSKIASIRHMRKFCRAKIIADVYIPAYSNALDYRPRESWAPEELERFLQVDRDLLTIPDRVVHMNRAEISQMEEYTGVTVPDSRLAVIPPTSRAFPQAQPSPSGIFRIAWWGSFGPLHGLDLVLKAAGKLKEEGLPFQLDLYGSPIKGFGSLAEELKTLGLDDRVVLHTNLSFGDGSLVRVLGQSTDLALGHFGLAAKSEHVITNKLVEALALGLPVLTKRTPVLSEFLSLDDDLFTCAGEPSQIAAEIRRIAKDPSERARRASNGLARWNATFSEDAFDRAVADLMATV